MITLGVDLSSQPEQTATCVIRWNREVVIDEPTVGVTDRELAIAIPQADKVGIDVPLGWPEAFVNAVAAYHSGEKWSGPHSDPKLRLRDTDRFVWAKIGHSPLSVSTDKIAMPAMRAAWLLSNLSDPLDRLGTGRIVEVYPAAALIRWGFDASRYKGDKGKEIRLSLVNAFEERIRGWVRLNGAVRERCLTSDDAFDALVSALVARAAAKRLCEEMPASSGDAASREGWIALPIHQSLERLA